MKTISIEINDRRKAYTVKELFSNEFPNLKLEFYAKPHTPDGPHSEHLVTSNRLTIGDCRTSGNDGTLTIDPQMTTTGLKSYLGDTFGLKAEIYRWSGSSWQPVKTGQQSLEELNRLNGITLYYSHRWEKDCSGF
jgi:hypothetical protein